MTLCKHCGAAVTNDEACCDRCRHREAPPTDTATQAPCPDPTPKGGLLKGDRTLVLCAAAALGFIGYQVGGISGLAAGVLVALAIPWMITQNGG